MKNTSIDMITARYPVCAGAMNSGQLALAEEAYSTLPDGTSLSGVLAGIPGLPGFLPELARLEGEYNALANAGHVFEDVVTETTINPTLRLVALSWRGLAGFFGDEEAPIPENADEVAMLWVSPSTGKAGIRAASDEDLLVLKMFTEGISPETAAEAGNVPVGAVDSAIKRAARRGLLISPTSRITRDASLFPEGDGRFGEFRAATSFTLQWHITQACDLHCKHCYDRSSRTHMNMSRAVSVLDDMRGFCLDRHVDGHVTFSGGNPLLYPHFEVLYKEAVDRGLGVSILGNPAGRETLERLVEIKMPSFFQVSLEGLEAHNDDIRGAGHYRRVLEFLDVLGDLGIYSMVMLTLTRDNMVQVLELAGELEGRVDSFNFNRLSLVGEGANLALPEPDAYREFLGEYLAVRDDKPYIKLKDNLFNVLLDKLGREPFDGCTGFGCGAAFNFISVLADGEAHACRKFPSPIGNVYSEGIAGVYDSARANSYRMGPAECRGCNIRPVCGGCLAMAHSFGLDVTQRKDPFCFMEGRQ